MTTPELINLARQFAMKHGLNDALVCAICEQESNWDSDATRYEPAFFTRYILPLGLSFVEGRERATSWGLMQTMKQSVVEIGYTGTGLELCEPATGLEWGCQLFARKLLRAVGDSYAALLHWNGGGDPAYPQQVIDRMERYVLRGDDLQRAGTGPVVIE